MGRGVKVGCRGNFRKRARSEEKGSDDSDADYVVSDEKDVVSDDSEDYGSFLDGCASEESFADYAVDEDEDEVEEVKKVARPKPQRGLLGWKRKTGGKPLRKRKRAFPDDKDEEEDDEDFDVNDEDGDDEDNDDEKDEEFTPVDEEFMLEDEEFTADEDDGLEEEEEFRVTRKVRTKKLAKRGSQRKGQVRGRKKRKRSDDSRVSKKPSQKTRRRSKGLRRKAKSDDDDGSASIDKKLVVRKKSRKNPGRSRSRYVVQSDSDFVSSGSSDFEYTISEEEREQIREASELCRDLRSTTTSKKIEEDSFLGQLKWPPRRKGKEKVEEVQNEVGKQICGICLTEEDKRKVRGTLNCCSHYFCFTCIMAWSKVETRCPLCKQRFHSISKPARLNAGIDLRTVVLQVPERDQVYQPTEEEIRGYMDPYENVLCIECHQGGDDALMLLCDYCDSPAHTYCVGLGREVPEGNWYCEGCRPQALGSTSSHAEGRLPDQRSTNNLSNRPPGMNFSEGIDLNSFPSAHTTSAPGFGFGFFSPPRHSVGDGRAAHTTSAPGFGFGFFSPPRHSVGDGRAASPVTGAGASTLTGRRLMLTHILMRNRMIGRGDGISVVNSNGNSLSSQTNLGRETLFQPTRMQDMGPPPNCSILGERLPVNPSPLMQNMDILSSGLNHSRSQAVQNSDTIVSDHRTLSEKLLDEHAGINYFPGFELRGHCSSRPSIGSDDRVSPSTIKENNYPHQEKELLQSMVQKHLQNLSKDIRLDHTTLEEIARRSTHTTLAACGLEHARHEVCFVLQPFICPHIGTVEGGQISLMKGSCQRCFDSFVRDVVNRILKTKLPQWLAGTRV